MRIDFKNEDLAKILSKTKKKTLKITLIRLLVFFSLIPIFILSVTDFPLLFLLLLMQLVFFIVLIIQFNASKDKEAFIIELIKMEEEKSLRKNRKLSSFDPGNEYQSKTHPFAIDLDLFGEHSLFQLLNHTVNRSAKAKLAALMKENLNADKAKVLKPAVDELAENPDFLRSFEANGRAFIKEEKSKDKFYKWMDTRSNWKKLYFAPMIIGPVLGLSLVLGVAIGIFPLSFLSIWILFGLFSLSFVFKPLLEAGKIFPGSGDIKTYRIWSADLAEHSFEDEYLKKHSKLFKNQNNIPKGLKTLEQVSFLIENRINLMYLIFNILFWLDFFLFWKLEKWKKNYQGHLKELDSVFDHWQVLISLGAFTSEEGLNGEINWTSEEKLEFADLKHPLLRREKAVANDLDFAPAIQTVLLTGSNMSGKTTFMRTIGTNLVLANMGLRPFGKSLLIGPFQLYTSMRNMDNLGESVSSFYAELARIKQVLNAAENGQKVFFLMDEILKGTNTVDRIQGSEALIKQLANTGSKGIISTHDIELSALESSLSYLKNFSFHSEISDNEIHFDYKLKTGPCPSFNAHKLMELMGIKFS
ncbi:MutS-related protein [Arthrospiribacter ruber]|uniref:DNA mismatch repair protein n=1 Tax=Arthrospiribacter ruber TaxID=2487934 RepID=A0A951IWL9_9BACT|nr:DNA mismatch repair protein [Arthrospiribacter ruber]MBW3467549.1 DNA mismatch repair protein [Arthrospiribacter ruber]